MTISRWLWKIILRFRAPNVRQQIVPVCFGARIAVLSSGGPKGSLNHSLLVAPTPGRLYRVQFFLSLISVQIPSWLRRQWSFLHTGDLKIAGWTQGGQRCLYLLFCAHVQSRRSKRQDHQTRRENDRLDEGAWR